MRAVRWLISPRTEKGKQRYLMVLNRKTLMV